MGRLITFLIFLGMAATGVEVFAQDRSKLEGPKAKNYKPWKYRASKKQIVTSNRMQKKALEAKNYEPWKQAANEDRKIINTTVARKRLTGPKAKNKRVWWK